METPVFFFLALSTSLTSFGRPLSFFSFLAKTGLKSGQRSFYQAGEALVFLLLCWIFDTCDGTWADGATHPPALASQTKLQGMALTKAKHSRCCS